MSNDRINASARELGYHCAYCFLESHNGKGDSHKKMARMLKVGYSTIEYNRRKIRNGEMTCEHFKKEPK